MKQQRGLEAGYLSRYQNHMNGLRMGKKTVKQIGARNHIPQH